MKIFEFIKKHLIFRLGKRENTHNVEEATELEGMIKSISYDENLFRIFLGDDKFVFGATSGKEKNQITILTEYRTIYESIINKDWEIKYSLGLAINYTYYESDEKKFNPFTRATGTERLAYYYIDNSIFRLTILWDLLAQLYRLRYDIPVNFNNVHYKDIFNPKNNYSKKFKEQAKVIFDYINEEDNFLDSNDLMNLQGNHKFVNSIRNQMTHRNDPNSPSISDLGFSLKNPPSYLLLRIVQDYKRVSGFISTILKDIIDEIENEN